VGDLAADSACGLLFDKGVCDPARDGRTELAATAASMPELPAPLLFNELEMLDWLDAMKSRRGKNCK